jgi:histidinol-phosphate aminotransferase
MQPGGRGVSKLGERVREAVRELAPYQPGKPIEEVQRELGIDRIVKLASNEYPQNAFPEVIEALQKEILELHRYPDATWHDLLDAATTVYPIGRREILFGNGGNEILELLVHLTCDPGDEVIYAHPSFPIYGLLARSHFDTGVSVPLGADHRHDLDAMFDAISPRTRLVFVCNPNNPTGTWVDHSEMVAFMEKVPEDVLVVLDEAYVEFVTDPEFPRFFELRQRFANLASMRSFSKIYSLAALRIGYLIGSEEVVGLLQRIRQPFNVNRLAQRAAAVALRQQDRVTERREANRKGLEQLRAGLRALECEALPSQTNFLLTRPPHAVDDLFGKLLREGAIVRPMESFGLGEGSFRVNTGTPEENEIFLAGLGRVLRGEV